MNRQFQKLVLILLLGVWLSPAWASQRITLVYSGNLGGELEPCGCSEEGNLGGIQRRSTILTQLRKNDPSLVVVSSGGLLKVEGGGDRLKSDFILKGFASLNYDAIGMQWDDLAFGPEFVLQDKLPWTVSNWHDDSVPVRRLIQRHGLGIAFYSWLDPKASPLRKMQGDHDVVGDASIAVKASLAAAKQAGELTILASAMGVDEVEAVIGLKHIDILIQRSAYEVYGEPQLQGNTLVLTPGSRGMRLGKLLLELENGHIKQWQHDVLSMPSSVANAPELTQWYENYNAEVKAEYLKQVEIRKQQEQGESPFVGEEVCQTCHTTQHDIWSEGQHAIAFDDLEMVHKAFDPECIACHVVGFNKPGGYVDISVTSHLIGVQCESCHGAGRMHVESSGKTPPANHDWPAQQMCAQCHTQTHSPGFDFNTYWPKIAH